MTNRKREDEGEGRRRKRRSSIKWLLEFFFLLLLLLLLPICIYMQLVGNQKGSTTSLFIFFSLFFSFGFLIIITLDLGFFKKNLVQFNN